MTAEHQASGASPALEEDRTPSGPAARRPRRTLVSTVAAPLLLLLSTLTVGLVTAWQHTPLFSPVDELQYYDALYQFEDYGLVRQGAKLSDEAVHRVGCIGVFTEGTYGPGCPRSPQAKSGPTPFRGISTADAYTPLYIATAYYGSKIFESMGVYDELVAGRLTSPLWLTLGMFVFYLLARSFGLRRWLCVALGLCFLGSPLAWWSGTFLTTDAPGLFLASLVFLCARLLVLGKASGWWLVFAATLAVLFKVTHVMAIGAAVIYVAATFYLRLTATQRRALRQPSQWRSLPRVRWLGYCVLAVLLPVLAQVGWLAIRAANAVGTSPPVHPAKFGLGELALQLMNFLTSTFNWNGTMRAIYPMPPYVGQLLTAFVLLAVVGSVTYLTPLVTTSMRALRISALWAAVLAAPMLAAALFFTQGYYFSIPGRYGLSVAPLLLVFAAKVMPKRYLTPILFAAGIASITWLLSYNAVPGHY